MIPPNYYEGDGTLYLGEDDENMVSTTWDREAQSSIFDASAIARKKYNHFCYWTRVCAAEYLSHVSAAVGKDPAHFDLSLARRSTVNGRRTTDWLVLQIQELTTVAYQISTIQFENLQPVGVDLLCTIINKLKNVKDPDLPGHYLMEQYQAQLVSAVRIVLGTSSSPLLLESGLHPATKILTNDIISGDRAAVKCIFSLISRPLSDFNDLYYPFFAEWVTCKIKIRLLVAHAFVKSYIYAFLRRQQSKVPDEYLALIPYFLESSFVLSKYRIWILKDYHYICFHLQSNSNYKLFLDGIQSPLVSSKLILTAMLVGNNHSMNT